MKFTGIVIALIQLLEIVLHAATNQLEPLRVSSNLVILLWLAITASGRLADKFRWLASASTGTYLLLNLVFLALEGLTNPEQGGALRVALLLFVFTTVMLSGLFAYMQEKSIWSPKELA